MHFSMRLFTHSWPLTTHLMRTRVAFAWNERFVVLAEKVTDNWVLLFGKYSISVICVSVLNDTINNSGGYFSCAVHNWKLVWKNCKNAILGHEILVISKELNIFRKKYPILTSSAETTRLLFHLNATRGGATEWIACMQRNEIQDDAPLYYRPHSKGCGNVMFSQVSVRPRRGGGSLVLFGEGAPSGLRSLPWSLVPGPFWGVPLVLSLVLS